MNCILARLARKAVNKGSYSKDIEFLSCCKNINPNVMALVSIVARTNSKDIEMVTLLLDRGAGIHTMDNYV